jgi:hypothetical protein
MAKFSENPYQRYKKQKTVDKKIRIQLFAFGFDDDLY